MSDRRLLGEVKNEGTLVHAQDGLDEIAVYRDNDTRSYRIVIQKDGHPIGMGPYPSVLQFADCMCCDVTYESFKRLAEILAQAVADHQPFEQYEEDED